MRGVNEVFCSFFIPKCRISNTPPNPSSNVPTLATPAIMKSESDFAEEADKMIESQPELKADLESEESEETQAFPYLMGVSRDYADTRAPQSLDTILEQIKQTLQSLQPPKNSSQDIFTTWDFIKELRKEEIQSIVNMIDKLTPDALLGKVSEIEQLAHRLDVDQTHQFLLGEEMNIMRR